MLTVATGGIQKANADSNPHEHMVQRGKVNKRKDREEKRRIQNGVCTMSSYLQSM